MSDTKKRVISVLALLATILYPCLFMYFQNADESKFYEMFPALGKFLLLAVFIFAVTFLILRNFINSIFFTEIAMLVAMNFNSILNLVRKVYLIKKIVLFAAFAVVLLVVLIVFKQKLKEAFQPSMILGIVFGALILVNLVTAVPTILKVITNSPVEKNESITEAVFSETPNVYYFIYDEYAGPECLERYYDYENEELKQFMEDHKVNVSSTSHNTESIFTATIVPNLLNLSYVASDDTYSLTNLSYTKNAPLYQMFQNNGYTVNMINHNGFLYDDGCNVLNYVKKDDTISKYIVDNSIVAEIEQVVTLIKNRNTEEVSDYGVGLYKILRTMESSSDMVSEKQPTLTIGYVQTPHTPLVFDREGNWLPAEQYSNWRDKSIYLGMLQFTNHYIESTIENIQANDPDALIIIQSDHGARLPHWLVEDYGDPAYDATVETPYMQNILNCVYYKGETLDIEGLTGINTLRSVFNQVLGTDLESIDAPEGFKASTGY